MKKIIFSITFILLTIHLLAQIAIQSDNIIDIGEKVEIASSFSLNALHDASSGEDLVWDYSSLIAEETAFLEMQDPSSVEGFEYFPEANMVGYSSEESTFFYQKSNEAFDLLGLYESISFQEAKPHKFEPYQRIITFPSTYETSYVNEFKISNTFIDNETSADSTRSTTETVLTSAIDAWGELTTPFGTFDVIRQHLHAEHTFIEESFTDGEITFSNVTVVNAYGVRFWSNDENTKYAVLEYEYNPDDLQIISAFWLNSTPIVNTSQVDELDDIVIYPNPSDGKIIIDGLTKPKEINVINYFGEKVYSHTISPLNNSLNLEALSTGVYYINHVNEGVNVNKKLVLK